MLGYLLDKSKIDGKPPVELLKEYYYDIRSKFSSRKIPLLPQWVNPRLQNVYDEEYPFHYTSFEDLTHKQINKTSLPFQLHSEDRNAMMFSVESRQPFLDHRLVEFCLSIPPEYKMNKGWSKSIIRDAFPALPHSVRYRRKKLGFPFPEQKFISLAGKSIRDYLGKYSDLYFPYLSPRVLSAIKKGGKEISNSLPANVMFRLFTLCVWHELRTNKIVIA
jgi:hypothetical protein